MPIIVNDDLLPATGLIGGVKAGVQNFGSLIGSSLDYSAGITPEKPRNFIQTKGVAGTVGELFNPINLALGALSGGALGAVGAFTAEASGLAIGATGAELLGSTVANVAPKVLTGAIEGAGWTALDHFEKVSGGINDEISAKSLAVGATLGATLGGLVSLIPKNVEALSPMAKDVDTKLNTITAVSDKHYNPQNKMGYTLSTEIPEPKKINNAPEISPATLDKIKLSADSDILKRDKDAILQAQRLVDTGYSSLKDVDDAILGNTVSYSTKYHGMLADSEHGKTISSGSNIDVRKAIHKEYEGLNDSIIQAGDLANELNESIYKDAKNLNIDRGFIDGWIQRSYDPLKLSKISFDDFKDTVAPRLSTPIPDDSLRSAFESLISRDIEHQDVRITSNPYKARVFNFKDAQSEMEIEQAFGSSQHVGAKITQNIDRVSELHGRVAVIGTESPEKVLKYFAKLKDINPLTASNKIGSMLNLGKSYTGSDALVLGGQVMQTLVNVSRGANAIFKPFYGLINTAGDLTLATMNAVGSYGISNTLKAIISKAPTEDIKVLARLPNERETFKGMFNEFKNDMRHQTLEIMGMQLNFSLPKYNKLIQSGSLKLGGMHMLDKFVRNWAIKLSAVVLKHQYKADGLAKMFPNLDKDILKYAVNDDGFLSPTKLTNIADKFNESIMLEQENIKSFSAGSKKFKSIEKNIQNIKYEQQRYRDTASKLYQEYAKINRVNPIYSNDLKWLSKADPAISAGARTVLWPLRMIAGLYQSFLEGTSNNNKVLALSGVASASMALSLIETAQDHIIHQLTGEKEMAKRVPLVNDKLKELIPDDFNRNFAINTVNKMIPLSMLYNAPVFYGSGSHAVKSAYYDLTGNEDKAEQQFKKSMPWVAMMSNVFSSHTP